jgi:hypothetical protein
LSKQQDALALQEKFNMPNFIACQENSLASSTFTMSVKTEPDTSNFFKKTPTIPRSLFLSPWPIAATILRSQKQSGKGNKKFGYPVKEILKIRNDHLPGIFACPCVGSRFIEILA